MLYVMILKGRKTLACQLQQVFAAFSRKWFLPLKVVCMEIESPVLPVHIQV